MLERIKKRFTKNQVVTHSEIKDTSIYISTTLLIQVCNFIIIPILWRKLTPADFGIIAITEIIGQFIIIILGLALDSSITRFYYEWPEENRKKYIGSIWLLSLSCNISIGLTLLLIFRLLGQYIFPEVSFYPYLLLGIIYYIFLSLNQFVLSTIRIKKLSGLYAAHRTVFTILKIGLNLYVVLILDKGVTGFLFSNALACLLTLVFGIVIMVYHASFSVNVSINKQCLKFSLPIVPSTLIKNTTLIMDKFILQRYLSLDLLGIYSISSKFGLLVTNLYNALKLSYLPHMLQIVSSEDKQNIKKLSKSSLIYFAPIVILACLIILFIDEFVHIINREDYFAIVNYVPFLVSINVISATYIFFTPGLFLSKRTDLMWIPTIIELMSIIIGGYFLIRLFSLYGAILAKFMSSVIFFLVSLFFSNKYYKLPIAWIRVLILVGIVWISIIISIYLRQNQSVNAGWGLIVNILIMVCISIIVISILLNRKIKPNTQRI